MGRPSSKARGGVRRHGRCQGTDREGTRAKLGRSARWTDPLPRWADPLPRWVVPLMLGVSLAACAPDDAWVDQGYGFLAATALQDRAVLVDDVAHRALLFDVSRAQRAVKPQAATLPAHPRSVQRRARPLSSDPDEVLVLCAGEHDLARGQEAPALAVLSRSGVDRVYRLPAAFNALVQSDDGKYAFLFFDPSAQGQVDRLAFNPNEVAIVDLSAPPAADTNPRQRSLMSLGSLPKQVVFSPPMQVVGKERRLAVVLFDSDVAVLDIGAPDRPPVTFQLASADGSGLSTMSGQQIGLSQVLFGETDGTIYLRGDQGPVVYALPLVASSRPTENDFTGFVQELWVGSPVSDIALYQIPAADPTQPAARRLLAVTPSGVTNSQFSSGSLSSIDVATSKVVTVGLARPASQIHLFRGASPFDESPSAARALLYAPGTDAVTFVDLEALEAAPGESTQLMTLDDTYSRLLPLDAERVMLIHQQSGLSVVELQRRSIEPLSASVNLGAALADPDDGKLWLGPPGETRVGFLDLATSHPDEVQLDAPIDSIFLVPSESTPKLVVRHPSALGYLTMLDAHAPSRDTAYSVRGFLLGGALDRGE